MTQDIALRKLLSIEKLTQLQDDSLLLLIEQLLDTDEKKDWAESLSDKEKQSLERGLKDIEEGKTETYDEFQKRMQQKFK